MAETTEFGTSLPDGMTCGDCQHIRRCMAMFGHEPADTYCDWAPSRFRLRGDATQEPAR